MNLGHLVSIVQGSRNLTAMVFPLPDVGDCVDYAITEAGEYLDATLRTKRQGDKRNHDKEHDERKEWGQCGYMIASAMMQIENCEMDDRFVAGATVYTTLCDLCTFQRANLNIRNVWLVDALADWAAVCKANGWPPANLLKDTCTAFEFKHLPELFEAQHG